MSETFAEVRCIACVPLGWYSSHLLLRITGAMKADGVRLQMKCPRCKSVVEWEFGKPHFTIIKKGLCNPPKRTAVFE